LIASTQAYC